MLEKSFVKAKPLKDLRDKNEHYRPRQPRKNGAKRYEQKVSSTNEISEQRNHEVLKYMLSTYKYHEMNLKTKELLARFPKYFREEAKAPESSSANNFSSGAWNIGSQRREQTKKVKLLSSDTSDPDWNSGSDKEVNLASRKIGDEIIKKVNNRLPKNILKPGQLQKHERQFLEDYYIEKKNVSISNPLQGKQNSFKQPENPVNQKNEGKEKNQNVENEFVWNEYNPQVNALIHGGFLKKVEEPEHDISFGEDDFNFEENHSSSSPSSSSSDDDMFTDQGPRTRKIIFKKTDSEIQREGSKGTVRIPALFFTELAKKLNIEPGACNWVISNLKGGQFKVTTKYMNEYYETANLSTDFPFISLNQSPFVFFKDIETQKSRQTLKTKYKIREKQMKYVKGPKYHYRYKN